MLSSLVGRDRELALLLGCLDEAQRGRANLVVCVGEPGVGKITPGRRAGWLGWGEGVSHRVGSGRVNGRRAAVLALAGGAAGAGG